MGIRGRGILPAMRGLIGKCGSVRPLLAASLYEPLGEEEQQTLEKHLEGCARCRALLTGLRGAVRAIPGEPARFDGDLAPALRARIAEIPGRTPVWRLWPYPAGIAALAAVMLLVVAGPFLSSPTTEKLATAPIDGSAVERVAADVPDDATRDGELLAQEFGDSPVSEAVCEADRLIERQAYVEAMRLLQESLASYPGDPAAGVAQARLADIEFRHLRRYPRAFDAYVKLRNQFPQVFTASPESIDRFDLLVEGWQENFEPLYALDVARENGTDGFADLESLIAQNPGKLVALLALEEMRHIVDDPEKEGDLPTVAALETVRSRCVNPVAIAQVDLRLGDAYSHDMRDLARARELYLGVAQGAHPVLAPIARDALARLDNP